MARLLKYTITNHWSVLQSYACKSICLAQWHYPGTYTTNAHWTSIIDNFPALHLLTCLFCDLTSKSCRVNNFAIMLGWLLIRHMCRPMGNQQSANAKTKTQISFNREADQRLCFRYSDSTIPLLHPKFHASSLLL